MKQAAVGIVALELDFERSGEVERLSGLDEARLDIVGLLCRVGLAELISVFVADLLPVVVDKGFLFHIAVVVHGAAGSHTVLVGSHDYGRFGRSIAVLSRSRVESRSLAEGYYTRFSRLVRGLDGCREIW